ncbi:hypothetical protein ACIP9H_17710 [Streptomyces sp. NPDC088732]
MHDEVIAVFGERGVFGEDERGDDGGFAHVFVAVQGLAQVFRPE